MLAAPYSDGSPLLVQDRMQLIARGLGLEAKNNLAFLSPASSPLLGATPNIAATTNLTLKNGTPLNATTTYIPAGTSVTTSAASLNAGLLANAGQLNLARPATIQHLGAREPIGLVPRVKSFQANADRQMTRVLDVFVEFNYGTNHGVTQDDRLPAFSVP